MDVARLRVIAENVTDAVIELDRDGRVTWASESITSLIGFDPDELIGRTSLDLIDSRDASIARERRARVLKGETLPESRIRFRHAEKGSVWVGIRPRPIFANGAVSGSILALSSRDDEVTKDGALEVLVAGMSSVSVAQNLQELLQKICDTATLHAPYVFAWYGDKLHNGSVGFVAMSRAHREYLSAVMIRWDSGPTSEGPTGRAMREGVACVVDDIGTSPLFAPWREAAERHGFRSSLSFPVRVSGEVIGAYTIYADLPRAFSGDARQVFAELATQIGLGIERLRSHEQLRDLAARNSLLASAIDQAKDSVIVTDANGVIVYANDALYARTGYEPSEVIGSNPRIFQSGLTPASIYEDMWSSLARGRNWSGQVVNRTKDGQLLYEDLSIAAMYENGIRVGFVGVRHDRTEERHLQDRLSDHMAERLAVADILGSITVGESLEASIENVCTELMKIQLVDSVCFVSMTRDGLVIPTLLGPPSLHASVGSQPFAPEFPEQLARLHNGPIMLDTTSKAHHTANRRMIELVTGQGTLAAALIPVFDQASLTGFVAVGSRQQDFTQRFNERAATFREIGVILSKVLGRQSYQYSAAFVDRQSIQSKIDDHQFSMVFQPIVDMSTMAVVGYEALARFDSNDPPDVVFAEADRLGLLRELEIACARDALKYAAAITPNMFVSLNFSPDTILSGALVDLLSDTLATIVIEVTEHAAISDYAAIKSALAALPSCRLAIDDAGAGHASLRHITELQPSMVKIDISLIRDVDTNHAKSALIAGLMHFSRSSGTLLIAEGVETSSEAHAIAEIGRELNIPRLYGQGFLWGRASTL